MHAGNCPAATVGGHCIAPRPSPLLLIGAGADDQVPGQQEGGPGQEARLLQPGVEVVGLGGAQLHQGPAGELGQQALQAA